MKNIIVSIIGVIMTVSLMFLMTTLIAEPKAPVKPKLQPKSLPPVSVEKERPPKPEQEKPQPPKTPVVPSIDIKMDMEIEALDINNMTAINFSPSKTDLTEGLVGIRELQSGLDDFDREAVPLMQTAPAYPVIALQKGLEGWVKLNFDVDSAGFAQNITIVDASHRKVFDKEAKRALRQWKFQPGTENGMATGLSNQKVTMEFKLDQ